MTKSDIILIGVLGAILALAACVQQPAQQYEEVAEFTPLPQTQEVKVVPAVKQLIKVDACILYEVTHEDKKFIMATGVSGRPSNACSLLPIN